jgi:polar amino acid transport system substrate-binding protein
MKRIFALIMTLVLMATAVMGLSSCGNKTDVEAIKDKGKIVVGVTVYKPMDYQDENKKWIGFDAEMAEKFAEQLGVDVEFVVIDWEQKVTELKSGNIDLIWNGMTATAELDAEMDFSVSYAENRQVAVIKKSNAAQFNSVDTVKTAKIAVEKSSAGDTVATETLGASTVARVTAQNDALLEVKSGQSEVAIIDYTMAYSVVGKGDYEDLMIVDVNAVSFEREVFAVGARTGSDLVAELNKLFKAAYADGTMKALAEKYSGVALNDEALSALD